MNKYLTARQKACKDTLAWLKEHERSEIPARIEHLHTTYPFKGYEYDQAYHDNCMTLLFAEQQYPGRVCDLVVYDFLWDLWHEALAEVKKSRGRGHTYAAWNSIAREIDVLNACNRHASGSGYDGSVQTLAAILGGVQHMTGNDSAPPARVGIWQNWCEKVAAFSKEVSA